MTVVPGSWPPSADGTRSPELAMRSALHVAGLRFPKDLRLDLGSVKLRRDIDFLGTLRSWVDARCSLVAYGARWHRVVSRLEPFTAMHLRDLKGQLKVLCVGPDPRPLILR